MKKIFVLCVIGASLLSAADKKANPKPAAKPAPAASSAPASQVLPAGAVEAGPYTWTYTDAKGVKWVYRQTPFGLVKLEDLPSAAPAPESGTPVLVTDMGETVKFEKSTPFGNQKWSKSKADLTDEEKALMAGTKPGEPVKAPVLSQGGVKPCVAGDNQPPGTVVAGYKKVVSQTPFGAACRWEPAK